MSVSKTLLGNDLWRKHTNTYIFGTAVHCGSTRWICNMCRYFESIDRVIGAFLAEEFEKEDMASTNRHETIYVVSPEMNSNNQLLFRDNIKPSIAGKHVILLSAS